MALSESMEMPSTAGLTPGPIAVFSNSYARLPEHFFARRSPTAVAKARLIKFNESLASELGLDTRGLEPDELAAMFAGNVTPSGAEPIAMVYAGHQFGNFVPQLGDGRAILLGEVLDRSGERRDVRASASTFSSAAASQSRRKGAAGFMFAWDAKPERRPCPAAEWAAWRVWTIDQLRYRPRGRCVRRCSSQPQARRRVPRPLSAD